MGLVAKSTVQITATSMLAKKPPPAVTSRTRSPSCAAVRSSRTVLRRTICCGSSEDSVKVWLSIDSTALS